MILSKQNLDIKITHKGLILHRSCVPETVGINKNIEMNPPKSVKPKMIQRKIKMVRDVSAQTRRTNGSKTRLWCIKIRRALR